MVARAEAHLQFVRDIGFGAAHPQIASDNRCVAVSLICCERSLSSGVAVSTVRVAKNLRPRRRHGAWALAIRMNSRRARPSRADARIVSMSSTSWSLIVSGGARRAAFLNGAMPAG